ncbi:MAG TPA: GntR family transcriptional regulator [Casimicrobiaceae bacterium]|nr:GntR family transcriptional regulator [Casimicrobiaceae bacterium]
MKKPKQKSLMREVAYERFKAQLFKRNLVPGQFVSQGELCELLDVPLGPTREALKRLEAESLVRLIPQRGIQIADIGVTLIREAFEFRTVLELAAVRRFTESADLATVEKLAKLALRDELAGNEVALEELRLEPLVGDLAHQRLLLGLLHRALGPLRACVPARAAASILLRYYS